MKVFNFSQQGKRSNNEDSLGFSEGLLTVCDGMGGHNFGERASAFVKDAMLQSFPNPRPLGKMEILQQLNQVQAGLNQLLETEPELEKMGTTFTGIFITPDVWYAAHIGDSRIYLFRPSEKKLWHTWDHSLVGELMRTREITTEAGRFHPLSNRISKALIAQKDGKPVSASIVKIDELKAGDILLLCSDGVVEAWGDWELVQLFADITLSFEQKCEKVRQQCDTTSKDNNTAIIAEISEKDAFSYGTNDELDWTTFAEVEADYKQYLKDNGEIEEEEKPEEDASNATNGRRGENENTPPAPDIREEEDSDQDANSAGYGDECPTTIHTRRRWIVIIMLLLVAAAALYFAMDSKKSDKNTERLQTEQTTTTKKAKAKKSQKKSHPKNVGKEKKQKTNDPQDTIKKSN